MHAKRSLTSRTRCAKSQAGLTTENLSAKSIALKTEDSFKAKLAVLIDDLPDKSLSEHLADMKDSVRYTIQSGDDLYAHNVKQAMDELTSQGYECVKLNNSWGSDGYQGINSFWRDPTTGQIFEMQFHTPSSFDAKMSTHALYEEERQPQTSDTRRAELADRQAEIFHDVPTPPGAPDIQTPTNKGPR